GLISDTDQNSKITLKVDGVGAEYISLPESVDIGPKQSIIVTVNVTIPAQHPGNVILHPVVYAIQSGKSDSPTVVNIQMQKTLTIVIGQNPDAHYRSIEIRSFEYEFTLRKSNVTL